MVHFCPDLNKKMFDQKLFDQSFFIQKLFQHFDPTKLIKKLLIIFFLIKNFLDQNLFDWQAIAAAVASDDANENSSQKPLTETGAAAEAAASSELP